MPISKVNKLQKYMVRTDCYFIGDKKSKRYHNKDCPNIAFIANSNLIACGPNPEGKGFKPCSICNPIPRVVKKNLPESRSVTLQKALSSLAERHGMHVRFANSNAYISTFAGEWFFNYTNENIVLYHKNLEVRCNHKGDPIPGDFHVQKISFKSPLEVLSYIAHHEKAAENRRFAANAIQITSRTSSEEGGGYSLFLGDREIRHGDVVDALFPDGWHEVTIRFRDGKWYIATDGYSGYSPVGLFAKGVVRNLGPGSRGPN